MNPTPDRVTTHRRFGTGLVARILAGGIAAGSVVGLFATAGPANAAPDKTVHKSYVCKYVGKPGVDERLQTGQNPIWVDNHSLFRSPEAYNAADGLTYVGQQFNDRQVKSVVIVANTAKLNPEPSVKDCPPVPPPTTTTTSKTSTTTTTTTTSSTTSTTTSPTSTTTSTTTPPPETITTATFHPPTSTTSTTSSSSTTTPVTPPTTTTTTPATVATLYPLQPVKAGVNSDGTTREVVVTPLRVALVLLVLFGLWVAFGGRLPHVRRVGSPRDGS